MRGVAKLHRRVREAQEKVLSAQLRWDALVAGADEMTARVEGTVLANRPQFTVSGQRGRCAALHDHAVHAATMLEWRWRAMWAPVVHRVLAVTCSALTALILWSELTLASPVSLSPWGALLASVGSSIGRDAGAEQSGVFPITLQVLALLPLAYMSLCTYSSLFKLRLFGTYSLHGGRQSAPGALLFNSMYLIRLQFPLGYNYLRILRYDAAEGCAFKQLMSSTATVPLLGTPFIVYAPLAMVVLCALTVFSVYARLLRFIGLEHEDLCGDPSTDPESAERIEEGKALIRRAQRGARRENEGGVELGSGVRSARLPRQGYRKVNETV